MNAKYTYKKKKACTDKHESERRQEGITVYPDVLKIQCGPLPVYGSVNGNDRGGVEI